MKQAKNKQVWKILAFVFAGWVGLNVITFLIELQKEPANTNQRPVNRASVITDRFELIEYRTGFLTEEICLVNGLLALWLL